MLAKHEPHRKFRGPRCAARNSSTFEGKSKRPDLMRRQLVLVEYGER